MRNVAGTALTVAALFLGLVAVMIDAPALFYMSFALIATLLACNLQSKLAGKALRIERIAPKSVHIGELVTVEIVLWSERKIKRPLVTVDDLLPTGLVMDRVGPSLPVAPAFDLPVRTMYQFRANRRGRFRWKNLRVTATDALGLTRKTVSYTTEPTEIIVIPNPIPVMLDLPSSAGWGTNEAISGQAAGAGLEPRGIRQYASGDSLRHVHWRSSARTGTLQVKEFQAGAQGSATFVIQRTTGTDRDSVDLMCGHSLFLCEQLLRQGVAVTFPLIEEEHRSRGESERIEEIALMLGLLMPESDKMISEDLFSASMMVDNGATIYLLVGQDDGNLANTIEQLRAQVGIIVLAYGSAISHIETYRRAGATIAAMTGAKS
jgi:uncharacterized protein (DUF58 family)